MKRHVILVFIIVATATLAAQQVPKGQMPTLGRPTETGDTVPLFDFDPTFSASGTFEWSMPETRSPRGPIFRHPTVTKLDGRFYEAISEGEGQTHVQDFAS